MKNILFITHPHEDYLQDQILTGMRRLEGVSCIDVPKKKPLYRNSNIRKCSIYGNGFTTWKILGNKYRKCQRIKALNRPEDADLIVFGSIWRQKPIFEAVRAAGLFAKTGIRFVFLDGEDIAPKYSGSLSNWAYRMVMDAFGLKSPFNTSYPVSPSVSNEFSGSGIFKPALGLGMYFKREINKQIVSNQTLPHLNPTSFSIPSEKIAVSRPAKTQLVSRYVTCQEARKIDHIARVSSPNHVFDREDEYRRDLANSLFGITERRGGWDGMRHYEIAASWAVPCIHNLSNKPPHSPPHGLEDMHNCISFKSAQELREKMRRTLRNGYYPSLQKNAYRWVHLHTCRAAAKRLLNRAGLSNA